MSKELITVRVGLDDTDHPESGCTTHSFNSLLHKLSKIKGVDVLDRMLIRLWPYATRRTRGNGALSSRLSLPAASKEQFMQTCSDWFDKLLHDIAGFPQDQNSPSPALLISFGKVPENWYWEAVRGEVGLENREEEVNSSGITVFSHPDKWGIIGASSAISWNPPSNHSWELIAWRKPHLIGTKRIVSKDSVMQLSELFADTFMNRDPTSDKGIIAPRTPCPVLYGIRGASKEAVESAHIWMQDVGTNEKCDLWASHMSNQLSDDHLLGPSFGTVISDPRVVKGAHASLRVISEGLGETLVAFSEGGPVNRLLRQLSPGDLVSWMGLRSPDEAIHLEKLKIVSASPRITTRPRCCGKSMRSKGKNQDLSCDKCKRKAPKYWLSDEWSPDIPTSFEGWTQPPPSQRRHLSMPLELGIPS